MTLSTLAQARTLSGKVLDVTCGEFDPYIIGDQCVILIQDHKMSLTSVLSHSDYFVQFDPAYNAQKASELIGHNIRISNGCLRRLTRKEFSVMYRFSAQDKIKTKYRKLKNTQCFSLNKG